MRRKSHIGFFSTPFLLILVLFSAQGEAVSSLNSTNRLVFSYPSENGNSLFKAPLQRGLLDDVWIVELGGKSEEKTEKDTNFPLCGVLHKPTKNTYILSGNTCKFPLEFKIDLEPHVVISKIVLYQQFLI